MSWFFAGWIIIGAIVAIIWFAAMMIASDADDDSGYD